MSKDYPQYYALKFDLSVPSLQQVQQSLNDQDRYIEFAFVDTSLFAVMIERHQAGVMRFPADVVRQEIEMYTSSMLSRDSASLSRSSAKLYDTFIRDLLPAPSVTKLIIGPDEVLYQLSMGSILVPATGRYLVQDFDFCYTPSVDAWFERGVPHRARHTGILDVTPGFTQEMKDAYLRQTDTVHIDTNYLTLLSQPFMLDLSTSLSAQFQGKSYRTEEATESNVKMAIGAYALLHFGTHAKLDNSNPLLSRLMLAKEFDTDEDGYLHAYEIYGIPISADLAVLTACETGSGAYRPGLGIESLAHAFAYAGCPSVVMSLWDIDEQSTAEIIRLFYKNLRAGMEKSNALAAAQRAYLASTHGELRHPFYWSGLVLMGSDGVVDLGHAMHWWQWVIGALVLIIMVRLMIRRRSPARLG